MIVYNPANADTLASLVQSDGFLAVSQPGELVDALRNAWGADFRIVYTPRAGVMLDHFEAVNRIVAKCGRVLYAVDEVDKHQDPAYAPPWFYELINYGRHLKVAMIGTSRRPAQVSKEYTYGLTEICAFNVTEPGDLKYFAAKCGVAAVSLLPELPKYGYLRWMYDGRIETGKGW